MDLHAALVASCWRGALPPVDLRADCLVLAMTMYCGMVDWSILGVCNTSWPEPKPVQVSGVVQFEDIFAVTVSNLNEHSHL